MLRFHCALAAEAAPLNAHFGLQLLERTDCYSLFGRGDMQLLISGAGRERVDAAIAAVESDDDVIWFNIGIAGSAQFDYGAVVPVSAVSFNDSASRALACCCAGVEVTTVSQPSRDYPEHGLLDMELWHLRLALAGRTLYSMKVVSDTPERDFVAGKKELKDLMRGALAKIEEVLSKIVV